MKELVTKDKFSLKVEIDKNYQNKIKNLEQINLKLKCRNLKILQLKKLQLELTKIKIPFLWGKAVFKKSHWSRINLIMGPNGSGKTLLAQGLAKQFEEKGYSVRFIKSDRENRQEQMEVLKSNARIRGKIETVFRTCSENP